MDYYGMDNESLMLAIQLQQQDLNVWEQSSRSRKGKQRAGHVSDSDLALQACRHELEALASLMSDCVLGLRIARAIDSDARVIAEANEAENLATRDREFAMELSIDPHAEPEPANRKGKKNVQHTDVGVDYFMDVVESMNL